MNTIRVASLSLVAGLAVAAEAQVTSLIARARFTDRQGLLFGATGLYNDFVEYDQAEPFNGFDDDLGRDTSNQFGVTQIFTTQSFNEGGALEIYGGLYARGPWGRVRAWNASGSYFMVWPSPSTFYSVPIGTTADRTLPSPGIANDSGKAFSISQPIAFMYNYYTQRIGTALPQATVRFDSNSHDADGDGSDDNAGAYYLTGSAVINIDPGSWFDSDVIMHEYGHHVANSTGMHNVGVGGNHTFGVDLIHGAASGGRNLGDERGSQLAWNEGIATVLGLMANQAGGMGAYFSAATGNTLDSDDTDSAYDDFANPNETGGHFWASWETRSGSSARMQNAGQGEGDELSVGRALWDFYDAGAEAYNSAGRSDRINFGDQEFFNRVLRGPNHGGGVYNRTFRDSWYDLGNELSSGPGRTRAGVAAAVNQDHAMALAGETLTEYGIAHLPILSGMVDDTTPTFSWTLQNGRNSDFFQVLIFSTAWDLIYRSGQKDELFVGATGRHTLPAANALTMGVTYLWVVLNSPAWDDGIRFDRLGDRYNYYWSQANSITITPAPGAFALLAAAGLASRRKRRLA